MAALDLSLRLVPGATVPLAWRNLVADKWRLLRSSAGIAFAVLLMLVQLGFERAFFDASLAAVRQLDGDLFVMNASKYRFGARDPFAHRELGAIRAVSGVASAAPLYADWQDFFWTSPIDGKPHLVRIFAVDPDQPPVFLLSGIADQQSLLKAEGAVLVDRRSRRFLGMDGATAAKLNGQNVRVAGNFALGPDFMSDGTVITSDREFARLTPGNRGSAAALPIEAAVAKVRPGETIAAVQQRLSAALPSSLMVMTKPEIVEFERKFQAQLSSAAPIFFLGTLVGLAVGILISYQIIYTDLSDRLPQYATLKGIGYRNSYLVRSVLAQAALTGVAGYVPAWLLSLAVYRIIRSVALLPLHMTPQLTAISFALTLGMCLLAGALAIRRVIAADPAEIF
ncbi:MAG TPA: FtsX-like permease family protein [Stellaceae bacterium]|nr:FtsX-like permease family protein [Stellaceae bacterium]